MKKTHEFKLTISLITILSLLPLGTCIGQSQNESLSSQTDALFEQWDNANSPGCALAIIKDGEIVYSKGYGMADLEHNIQISPNTVFYIGSTSKQFVAMCVLLLEQENKLKLDDNIRKYLPDFPEYDTPITIRHLIHHTSGIRDYLTLWALAGNDYLDYMPEETVYDLICKQKELNFNPGDRFLYSNSCYFLLSRIIKEASGKSLKDYAEEKIFVPLGMKNSHFHDDNTQLVKNRAFGYSEKENGDFANLIMRFDLVGSGGLYTTAEDLQLWDQNFYDNKLGSGGQDLINKMHQNGKLNSGNEVNYAFALINGTYRGAKIVQHGGALGGYRTQLLRVPDHQFSVIILSNLQNFTPESMAYQVADIYLNNELEPENNDSKAAAKKPERKEIVVNPEIFENYIGRYETKPNEFVFINRYDNILKLEVPGQGEFQLFPESETKYFLKIVDAQITFQKDENGTVFQMTKHQGGQDQVIKKAPVVFSESQIENLSGEYYSSELNSYYNLSYDQGKLFVRINQNPKIILKPVGVSVFEAGLRDGKMKISLNADENRINGFSLDAGRVQHIKFYKN